MHAMIQALTDITKKQLSSSLASLYGKEVTLRLSLAQADVYIAMASSCTALPQQSILRLVLTDITQYKLQRVIINSMF